MRKEYRKALCELFTAQIKTNFPEWLLVSAPKHWYWFGEQVFVRDCQPGMWLVIVLQPDLKDHDAFNVEVGWSIHKRVPELSMRPCPDDPENEAVLNRGEYLCRLSKLVPGRENLHGYVDGWVIDPRTFSTNHHDVFAALVERQTKLSMEQARSTVSPFVDDAIAALAQYGIPYLDNRLPLLTQRHSHISINPEVQKSCAD